MRSGYQVVRYSSEYRNEVLELVKPLWGPDRDRNQAYFEWKYENNPYQSEILIYLATSHGEPVGMRGFIGSRWESGWPRAETLMLCAEDLVVLPEHRNHGVFRTITEAAFADLSERFQGFALSLSAGVVAQLGSLTMGWKSSTGMEPLGRDASSHRRMESMLGRLKRVPILGSLARMPWFNRPARFDRLDESTAGSGSIRIERDPDPNAMASLIERLPYDGRIRHVRDARYFSWRFSSPLREYRFLYAGRPLDGYLVLHRSLSVPGQVRPIWVSDCEGASQDVVRALVGAAVAGGRFPSIQAWGAALPSEAKAALLANGFVPLNRSWTNQGSRRALIRPFKGVPTEVDWKLSGRDVREPASWDFRMLYSMLG